MTIPGQWTEDICKLCSDDGPEGKGQDLVYEQTTIEGFENHFHMELMMRVHCGLI